MDYAVLEMAQVFIPYRLAALSTLNEDWID